MEQGDEWREKGPRAKALFSWVGPSSGVTGQIKHYVNLVALNYIIRHPTSGGETFALDDRGLEMCRKLRKQMKALSV